MSFENSFSSLSSAVVSGPGTKTGSTSRRIGREPAPLVSTRDWLSSGPLAVRPPKMTYFRSFPSLSEVNLSPPLLSTKGTLPVRVERSVTRLPAPSGSTKAYIKYSTDSKPYTPHIRKGCICSHPDAIHHVHRCVPRVKFSYENVPKAPRAMLNPTGMKSVYTRKTSSNKDNLVTFANAAKTVGSYKPSSPIKSNDWKLTTPRGSAWIHETKNSDWSANGYAMNKFDSQRKYYWHSYHREWKYKTNHSDALKSDAYRQHTLQIKSDEKGRTPLPEEIKTLYNQKKVNTPSIKYNKSLIYKTEEKPFATKESTRSTFEGGSPDYSGRGYYISTARTEIDSARAVPSSAEGEKVVKGKLEYSDKRNGRLSGRYKDFPYKTLLPDESIFDKPIDDRDKRKVRFESNPVKEIRYFIPDGTLKRKVPGYIQSS